MSETKLAEQKARWPYLQTLAVNGNPFATLCANCYGRHAPPRDTLCPHENIDITIARLKDSKS